MVFLLLVTMCQSLAVREAVGYGEAFYTRGIETAFLLDQGDPVQDPFYLPVRRHFSVIPRISLVATREDNLFLTAEDSEASTVIELAPGVLVVLGRPERRHVYIDYGLKIRIYDSSGQLDDPPSHYVMLGTVYQTARSKLDGHLGYRLFENTDTTIGARVRKEDYLVGAGVDYRLSGKTMVGGKGEWQRHLYSDSGYTDYDRLYAAARLYYDLSVQSQVYVQAGAGQDRFPERSEHQVGDADFHDVSLGIRGKLTPKTSASGDVGSQRRTYLDKRIPEVVNWIGDLRAEVNPFGFATFWGEVSAAIRPAVERTGFAMHDQRFTLGVSRRVISDRWRGNASVFSGRTTYSGNEQIGMESAGSRMQDGREDEYWGFSTGLAWSTRYNLSLAVQYDYTARESLRQDTADESLANDFEAGRWTLRASWNF